MDINFRSVTSQVPECRGIFLDLDNTLYDYEVAHEAALKDSHRLFCHICESLSYEEFLEGYQTGRELTKRYNKGTSGSRSRHIYFQRMLEERYGHSKIKECLTLGDNYWNVFITHITPRAWLSTFLTDAKKSGVLLVVITNLESSVQYRKLVKLSIDTKVDLIITSEEAGIEKPDERIFELALLKSGLKASNVVLLGDNPEEDGAGAAAMGITYVSCF